MKLEMQVFRLHINLGVRENLFQNDRLDRMVQVWLTEFGSIRHPETGNCYRLRGVRMEAHPHIISYANCYQWSNADHTWKTWNIYIGCSGAPGLRISKEAA